MRRLLHRLAELLGLRRRPPERIAPTIDELVERARNARPAGDRRLAGQRAFRRKWT
jgi:hypothetical protein